MKLLIKRILRGLFPTLALHFSAYRGLIKNKDSYLYLTGWVQSVKAQRPIDKNGNPIPWMNFPVVKFLEERLKSDLLIFEFGSGYSTYFYAKYANSVTSVEYNERWFQFVKKNMPENVELIFKEKDIDGDYCRVIGAAGKQFDVVIVDGRDRVNCIKQSIAALSPRGVILLDDSERYRYREGIYFAKQSGFRTLDMEGMKATGFGVERTTVIYRNGNCLGI
jgi:SAM-dependent methyltransferase